MSRRGENIYKRKDGRWEGRILKPDGKYQYVYADSYKNVKEKKNNFQELVRQGEKSRPAKASNSASGLFELWLEDNAAKRVKPSTYVSYYQCMKSYVLPYFLGPGKDRITELSAGQFVKSVYENETLSEAYRKKIITVFKVALRDIFKDSESSKQIIKAIKLPRTTYPSVEVFSIREQRLIEEEILKMNNPRALGVLLCFYTGIRLGELCALKWEDIDYEAKTMSIVKTVSRTKNLEGSGSKTVLTVGTPKSQHSARKIPLPDFMIELTSGLRNGKNEKNYILSNTDKPLDPRTYQRLFKKILECSGVKNRKFHAIRHPYVKLTTKIKSCS